MRVLVLALCAFSAGQALAQPKICMSCTVICSAHGCVVDKGSCVEKECTK